MDSVGLVEELRGLVDEYGGFILVMDNGAARTSRQTRAWLDEHPGVRVYTPRSTPHG